MRAKHGENMLKVLDYLVKVGCANTREVREATGLSGKQVAKALICLGKTFNIKKFKVSFCGARSLGQLKLFGPIGPMRYLYYTNREGLLKWLASHLKFENILKNVPLSAILNITPIEEEKIRSLAGVK